MGSTENTPKGLSQAALPARRGHRRSTAAHGIPLESESLCPGRSRRDAAGGGTGRPPGTAESAEPPPPWRAPGDGLNVTGLAAPPSRARLTRATAAGPARPERRTRVRRRHRDPRAARPAPSHRSPLICSRRRPSVEGCLGAGEGFILLISRSARFSRLKFLIARVTEAPIASHHDALRLPTHVGKRLSGRPPGRATHAHVWGRAGRAPENRH